MSDKHPVTMKDIAEAFGVSIATVSRALNGSNRVSEDKRKAICEYAQSYNFYPNDIAKSLRYSRSKPVKVIGVIVPEFTHYYFSSILNGIESVASAKGYRLIATTSRECYDTEVKICHMFESHQVSGVIAAQSKNTVRYDHFQSLIDRGIPMVFYDRICTGVNASIVVVDDYQGAYAAVSHLIECGCRRIAYYGMKEKTVLGQNRYNGYRDALLKHGIMVDESLVFQCDNRDDAERITPHVLATSYGQGRPDAFFCVNDDTAIGVMYSAKREGFKIPHDICVCGFTNGNRAIACDPMLTTVEQRGSKVGEEAADILINKIEGLTPKDKVEKRVVRTRLVVRGSTVELPPHLQNAAAGQRKTTDKNNKNNLSPK